MRLRVGRRGEVRHPSQRHLVGYRIAASPPFVARFRLLFIRTRAREWMEKRY